MDESQILHGLQYEEYGHDKRIPASSELPLSDPEATHNDAPVRNHAVPDDTSLTAGRLEKRVEDVKNCRILVLGPTGVGKSSFIKVVTGSDVPIGHSINSCTSQCKAYEAPRLDGVKYTLVDTPGFDDSSRDDLEILESIYSYFVGNDGRSISGILYFHRITENRMTGTSVLNLQILKELCGKGFYPGVTILSTMWNRISNDEIRRVCEVRERELIGTEKYWGEMIRRGTQVVRFEGDQASGLDTLRQFSRNALDKLPSPRLVRELNKGLPLEETSAGQVILEERRRREQERRQELEEEKAEIEAEKTNIAARQAEVEKEMGTSLRNENRGSMPPESRRSRQPRNIAQGPYEPYVVGRSSTQREREPRRVHSSRDRADSWAGDDHGRGQSIRAKVGDLVDKLRMDYRR